MRTDTTYPDPLEQYKINYVDANLLTRTCQFGSPVNPSHHIIPTPLARQRQPTLGNHQQNVDANLTPVQLRKPNAIPKRPKKAPSGPKTPPKAPQHAPK